MATKKNTVIGKQREAAIESAHGRAFARSDAAIVASQVASAELYAAARGDK